MWNDNKKCNIHIIRFPEGKKNNVGLKKYSKK